MRTAIPLCLLLLALPLPATASEERLIEESFELSPGQDVRFDFPVGSLRLEGVAGSTVAVEIELTCKRGGERCREAMEEVELDSHASQGRLSLEVDREPKWHWDNLEMKAVVRHPAERDLTVDMGVGELIVEGVRADLTIDLGVGSVEVTMPASAVRAVRLDAGVGETSLRVPEGWVDEERSFLVGGEVNWSEGKGEASVWVDLGVGEAKVELEE